MKGKMHCRFDVGGIGAGGGRRGRGGGSLFAIASFLFFLLLSETCASATSGAPRPRVRRQKSGRSSSSTWDRMVRPRSLDTGHQLYRRQNHSEASTTYEYCRFFDHQSAIVGNKIIVEGGLFTTATAIEERIWVHYGLLMIDFSSSFDLPVNSNSDFVTAVNLPEGYPYTYNGVLWPAKDKVVKYGGEAKDSLSFPVPEVPPTSGGGFWEWTVDTREFTQFTPRGDSVYGSTFAAYTTNPDTGTSYALGGRASYLTDTDVTIVDMRYLDNILSYDGETKTITNKTFSSFLPHIGSSLVHLPPSESGKQAGYQGLLLDIGGVETPRIKWNDLGEGDFTFVPMDKVWLYDPVDDKWFSQRTVGDPPSQRYMACAVVAVAPDRSSFNIIFHGGGTRRAEDAYGDVYVLTIPAFRWIQMPGSATNRIGPTCHIVSKSQMAVIGGRDDQYSLLSEDYRDDPGNWTGIDMEPCDPKGMLNILNMNTFEWQDEFTTNDEDYMVHSNIYNVIGGDETGGATVTEPDNGDGWDNQDLKSLYSTVMLQTSDPTEPTATESPPPPPPPKRSKKNNLGAILGGTVGATLFLIALALAIFCIHRKRRQEQARNGAHSDVATQPIADQAMNKETQQQQQQQQQHQSVLYPEQMQMPPYLYPSTMAPHQIHPQVNPYYAYQPPNMAAMHPPPNTNMAHPAAPVYYQQAPTPLVEASGPSPVPAMPVSNEQGTPTSPTSLHTPGSPNNNPAPRYESWGQAPPGVGGYPERGPGE